MAKRPRKAQLVYLDTAGMVEWVRVVAAARGTTLAEVLRDAVRAGLPAVARTHNVPYPK